MAPDNIFNDCNLSLIKDLFSRSKNIALISHKNPDGDTIGSNLALRYYWSAFGKNVTSVCVDKPKDYYFNFRDVDKFTTNADFCLFDLIVSLDASSLFMLGFEKIKPHLCIDHHISNTRFADFNFVDSEACSTSFVIYRIFKLCGWKITRDIATALLLGIYFDTGSFMHSNTNSDVLRAAFELTKLGADKSKIVKTLFKTMSLPQIKLWGRILERIKLTEHGITVSVVTASDLKECGASEKEIDRVIDFLNMNEEGKFCVLLAENDNDVIKGSLRSRSDDIDISLISKMFGGGGHKKAGGFSFPGKIIKEEFIKISG